jgi:hypothetical protein
MAWWWIEVKLLQRADKVVVASLEKLAREQDLTWKKDWRGACSHSLTQAVAVLWRPTSSLSPEKPVWTFDGTATNYNSISPPQDTATTLLCFYFSASLFLSAQPKVRSFTLRIFNNGQYHHLLKPWFICCPPLRASCWAIAATPRSTST